MSCSHGSHGWHGCGPCGPGDDPWSGPLDWYEETVRPIHRRYRRPAPFDVERVADDLGERLAGLQDEIRMAEAQLAALRGRQAMTTGPGDTEQAPPDRRDR